MTILKMTISIIMLLLTACVSTPYQKQGVKGGFTEVQLAENIFKVTFSGNSRTNKNTAIDYALLRSAEITLENGYKYFVIVNSETWDDVRTRTIKSKSKTKVKETLSGYEATTTTTPARTKTKVKPRASNTIICFSEKPEDYDLVYNADLVANSIRNSYSLVH